jgi:VCBS repeat-containing protein
MTNHSPTFNSGPESDSFSEFLNTTGSTALHQFSGTLNFKDSDKTDTHTTSAALHSAVLVGGGVIPTSSLTDFQSALTSQITKDMNGSGTVQWLFSEPDDDFDFLAKNQVLVLTYDVSVSDNHGGTAVQTVTMTITGTDDKPVIATAVNVTVNEQPNTTLSFTPDTAPIAVNFTDVDLANTNYSATVVAATASGTTSGLLPDGLGTAELLSFIHIDNVAKAAGSSSGTINATFSAPDVAFDYLAAGQTLTINYVIQLDDHAGGVTTQNVVVTVVGANDAPVFISGPESAHLIEDHNVTPAGNLVAHGDLFFSDVDLSDSHSVSTTVTASLSGGGSIPISNHDLLAALTTSVEDSTGHVLGEVDWDFALANGLTNFIPGGQTLTLDYKVTVQDSAGATSTQDVTITILGTNHPVVITSGPESSTAAELADTTGSSAIDTTPTIPAGTLNFSDPDTGDTHTVAVTVGSETWSGGSNIPPATQTDLAAALTTTLHDSTGSTTGSVDWNFGIADKDLDFLAAGETLTVNYNVAVSDASTTSTQTVSVTITGANDPVAITSGPEAGAVAEQPDVTGSTTPDATPTSTLSFTDPDLTDQHTVGVALDSAVWSASPFVPADTLNDLQSALTTALHDSTGSGNGGIDWTFSISDKDLDFLGAGETLTATYDVTISDGSTSSTQQVTVTATGASDPPVVNPVTATVADSPSTDAGNIVTAGNAIFDVGDSAGDASSTLSITAVDGQAATVGTNIAETYGTLFIGADGFYSFTANAALDQLQVGDTATEQHTITVTNSLGVSETTTLTLNFTGADDAPVINTPGSNTVGSITEDAGPTTLTNGGFENGNLTGWTASSGVQVLLMAFGGELGNYSAQLEGGPTTQTLSQDVATTPGQHYIVTFTVSGDPESTSNEFTATWDGTPLVDIHDNNGGLTTYSFDVVGDPVNLDTMLQFASSDDANGIFVDGVSVNPVTSPPTESSSGNVAFTDVEAGDTHTASAVAQGSNYVGTFTLDPVSETPGSGSVGWHFTVDNADIQFLGQGQVLDQTYTVTIQDSNGATTTQDVTVAIHGVNDAPTAVSETVVTDAGPGASVDIPAWALASNDTDPDTSDHLTVANVGSASGGTASQSGGNVFFTDDATLGGSFTYQAFDGIADSANSATATIVNNPTTASTLSAGSGDSILIATQGTNEALVGGAGNDVLIGNSGSHMLTGGGGNDTFAFLSLSDGPNTITDFNNTTEHDHIAVSASGFGGGLTAGMDVSSIFQTEANNQTNGLSGFVFDTADQTLYFSPDGTAQTALAQVQAGVTINPHDILVV